MKMAKYAALLGLLALPCLPGLARAEEESNPTKEASEEAAIVREIDFSSLIQTMKEYNFEAELTEDGESIRWMQDDIKTFLYIKDGNSIQFFVTFTSDGNATKEKINAWNRNYRYSRCYLDENENPCLVLDLDLAGGVTRERIVDFLKTCAVSLPEWISKVLKAEP